MSLDLNPVSVSDYREFARRRLPTQLFDYMDGGSYAEKTLADNVDAAYLDANRRALVNVSPTSPYVSDAAVGSYTTIVESRVTIGADRDEIVVDAYVDNCDLQVLVRNSIDSLTLTSVTSTGSGTRTIDSLASSGGTLVGSAEIIVRVQARSNGGTGNLTLYRVRVLEAAATP